MAECMVPLSGADYERTGTEAVAETPGVHVHDA